MLSLTIAMTDTTNLPAGLSPRARVFAVAMIVAIFVLGALASRRPAAAKTRTAPARGAAVAPAPANP